MADDDQPHITCPVCGRASWHPEDVREGYCGFCHDWTPVPTPFCFGCGLPPVLLLGDGTQAFCGNDDCRVFTWNPTKTVDELLEHIGHIDLPPMPEEP